jgi:2-methylcitrate dehydratase
VDRVLGRIRSFVDDLRFEALPPEVVHAAKRIVIDSVGCALGAYDSEPVQIGRRLASREPVAGGSTVIGSLLRTTPELAAYCNGTMIRYLDYNDSYSGAGGGGHPSDFLAAVLSAAELRRADGRAVITGLVAAYDVYCRMTDAVALNTTPWDYYRTMGAMASAAAAAKVLGLPASQLANAISIGIVPNSAVFETAVGEVSMWKACASGNAARNGVFAAILAAEGVTGPPAPFEGRMGFLAAVDRKIDPPQFGGDGHRFAILESGIKRYPSGSWSQTAIDAALQIRSMDVRPDDISAIEIGVHPIARQMMAGDGEKWRPTTREGADHSLPFVVSVALLTGDVTPLDFTRYLGDPGTQRLMAKVRVVADEDCAALFPEAKATRVTVTTTAGQPHAATVRYHLGHERNPVSDEDLQRKFRAQAMAVQSPESVDRFLERVWELDAMKEISQLLALTAVRADALERTAHCR